MRLWPRGTLPSCQHASQYVDDTIHFVYRVVMDQRHTYNSVIDINFGVQLVHDGVRVKVTVSYCDLQPPMVLSKGEVASKTLRRTVPVSSHARTMSWLLISCTTKLIVGARELPLWASPTMRTRGVCPRKNPSKRSQRADSCAAEASKAASRVPSGVKLRRYMGTPAAPCTSSYPGPPGCSL